MRTLKRWTAGLLAAAALLAGTTVPARAAGYTDLPSSHWAYREISRAASYEIMNGVTETLMQPNGTLTWAQYLAMLCRAFASDQYWGLNRGQGVPWDTAAWDTARSIGVLTDPDFLPVTRENMRTTPISRQDVAVLLSRVLPQGSSGGQAYTGGQDYTGGQEYYGGYRSISSILFPIGGIPVDPWDPWAAPVEPGTEPDQPGTSTDAPGTGASALTDFYQMDENHREAVSRLYDLNIIRGKTDGSFGPHDTIRRCDGAVLLIRTLDYVDSARSGERRAVTLTFQDGAGNPLGTRSVENSYVGQSLRSLASQYCPEGYKSSSGNAGSVTLATGSYTLTAVPMTQAEREAQQAREAVQRGEMTIEAYNTADFWLRLQEDNPRKCLLLFGDENWDRYQIYATEEEASANMANIQVPVWTLRNGKKSQSTMYLTVHQALAQDVTEIFTEIFNDPEQFPMESMGGWRYIGGSSTSEHNNGTAIDLNADQNYQIRDGVIQTGSCWEPGVNPYSIPADGSVVRIFAEHGWSWGGDAWAADANSDTGYHDYMHFSYRGR